jgi:hypothetical protein
VPRRVTLFALWAVFAVASVSVGFGAASLVSDPFTDGGGNAGVSDIADGDEGVVTEPGSSPTSTASSPTSSPSRSNTKHHTNSPTQSPAGSGGGTHSAGSTKTSNPPPAPSAVHRGIGTKGGYVSATCRGDLVSVGAAPAVWWQVDSITRGQVRSARVRLEPSEDANGERVEVTATCAHGIPVFTSEYHPADGGGGGGDDSSGSGGDSGGSDGSSGSGDG